MLCSFQYCIDTDDGRAGEKKGGKQYAFRPTLERTSVYAALLSGVDFFSFFFCLAANSWATAFCTFSASTR
jgi:hypothetical protein